MIEQIPIVVDALELVIMAGVQAMIQAMLIEQREEMRQMFHENRNEPTMPIEQPELNDG